MFVSFACHMAKEEKSAKSQSAFFFFFFCESLVCLLKGLACIFLFKHPLFGEQMLFFLGALFSPPFFALKKKKKTLSLPDIKHKKSFIPLPLPSK